MDDLLKTLIGKVFIQPFTRASYGPIRPASPSSDFTTLDGSSYRAFAEDSCGNRFTVMADGAVYFWDHETDELTFLGTSMETFSAHCVEAKPINLDQSKVISAWIDPVFAKAHGVNAPEDGWIKKADDHGIKKDRKPG